MKVYLIFDEDDNDYVYMGIENTDEVEIACFDSHDKAVDFIKEYMYNYRLIKNKGDHFTYYDPDDDFEIDLHIEELNVH